MLTLASSILLGIAGCGGGGSDGDDQSGVDIDKTDRTLTSLPVFLKGHEDQCYFLEGDTQVNLVDYSGDLANVTGLVCKNATLINLDEILLLTALQVLILENAELTDISVLQSLTTLEELDLSGNNITDITALGNLLGLILLNLAGNDIIDLSPLIALTNLKTLDVSGNNNLSCDDVMSLDVATAEMVDIAVPGDCTNTLVLDADSESVVTIDNSLKTVPYERVVIDVTDVNGIKLFQFENDLQIEAVIGDEVKLLVIRNWFLGEQYQVPEFEIGTTGVYSFYQLKNASKLGLKLTEDDDFFEGTDSSDYIFGLKGADVIAGGDGGDIIVGGPGDDHLSDFMLKVEGGVITRPSGQEHYMDSNNDTFVFNEGDGHDTLYLYETSGAKDKLQFTNVSVPEDISLIRDESDLIFKVNEEESVRVKNWFEGREYHLGTIIIGEDFTLQAQRWVRSKGINSSSDQLEGTNETETLLGSDGDDIIFGLDGGDTIIGGPGNDHLSDFMLTVEGDNITRPSGQDIYMDSNNDTFIFNAGDGHDTLYLYEESGARDRLQINNDINPDNITLIRDESDLIFKLSDEESIRVKDWFKGREYRLGTIIVGEDFTLQAENWVRDKGIISSSNVLEGSDQSEKLIGSEGDDIIYGLDGNDTIIGGPGNDHLSDFTLTIDGDSITRPSGSNIYMDSNNDTFIFNVGDGHDTLYLYEESGARDRLELDPAISFDAIEANRVGDDLVITLSVNDSVTIKDWFVSDYYKLGSFYIEGEYYSRANFEKNFL